MELSVLRNNLLFHGMDEQEISDSMKALSARTRCYPKGNSADSKPGLVCLFLCCDPGGLLLPLRFLPSLQEELLAWEEWAGLLEPGVQRAGPVEHAHLSALGLLLGRLDVAGVGDEEGLLLDPPVISVDDVGGRFVVGDEFAEATEVSERTSRTCFGKLG